MSSLCIGFTSVPLWVMYGEFWGSSWVGRMVLSAGRSVQSAELHSRFMGWGRVSIGGYLQGFVVRDNRELLDTGIDSPYRYFVLVEMYEAKKNSIKFLLYLQVVLLGGV
ncbi:hypothetical protein QYM36_004663 [Artemia franciscana]|uniref:Uncharacterized protein n=1 Tax=Artemia franciscana TaxID=6661 RepID=A0AA88IAY9_ARTSF|nr:hypothetical protein QYM36_004663 [Artemia franciscana]